MMIPISDKRIKEIAEFSSKSRDWNSAWVFGFSEIARQTLDKLGVEEGRKIKALHLFESGFVTNLYHEKTSKIKINHAEKISKGLSLSQEFLKKEFDNPHVKRFSASYLRSVKTGKREMFVTGEELQTLDSIFKKSLTGILKGKNKDFWDMMSNSGGKFVLEFGRQKEKAKFKSDAKWH